MTAWTVGAPPWISLCLALLVLVLVLLLVLLVLFVLPLRPIICFTELPVLWDLYTLLSEEIHPIHFLTFFFSSLFALCLSDHTLCQTHSCPAYLFLSLSFSPSCLLPRCSSHMFLYSYYMGAFWSFSTDWCTLPITDTSVAIWIAGRRWVGEK